LYICLNQFFTAMEEKVEVGPDDVKCESPDCKKYFKRTSGRKGKRFCNDGCRNAYNNAKKRKKTGQVQMINEILEKNHSILQELIGKKSYIYVPERTLRDRGFNFRYFTHPYESGQNTVYSVCYEFAYRKEENGTYKIIKEEKEGAFAK